MKTSPAGQTLTLMYRPDAVPSPPDTVELVVRLSGHPSVDLTSEVAETAGLYRTKYVPASAGLFRYMFTATYPDGSKLTEMGKIDIFPESLLLVSQSDSQAIPAVTLPRVYKANNGVEADAIPVPRINLVREVIVRNPVKLREEMEASGDLYEFTCQLDDEQLGAAASLDQVEGGTVHVDAWIAEVDEAVGIVLEYFPTTLVSVYVGQGALSETLRGYVFEAIQRATALSVATQQYSLAQMTDFLADLTSVGLAHLPVFVSTIFCANPPTPPPGAPDQWVYNGQPKPGAWEPISEFDEDVDNALAVFDLPNFVVRGVGVSAILLAETLVARIGP